MYVCRQYYYYRMGNYRSLPTDSVTDPHHVWEEILNCSLDTWAAKYASLTIDIKTNKFVLDGSPLPSKHLIYPINRRMIEKEMIDRGHDLDTYIITNCRTNLILYNLIIFLRTTYEQFRPILEENSKKIEAARNAMRNETLRSLREQIKQD